MSSLNSALKYLLKGSVFPFSRNCPRLFPWCLSQELFPSNGEVWIVSIFLNSSLSAFPISKAVLQGLDKKNPFVPGWLAVRFCSPGGSQLHKFH